ncbi:MAG: flagellar biosynthetic protein FliR [Lachnospiraceae bacterium]|nr:flagellar biosynthetic protein FliR [Lachnospiraceae bacterium]
MVTVDLNYADLEYFLLILVRVAAFVFVVPFFSMNSVPRRYRAALSVALSVLLYGVLPREEIVYSTVYEYTFIVAKEFITGVLIAMGVNLCSTILSLTGTIADMEVGFSMVTLMDPATRQQITITSTLYQYLIMLILVISGMYQYIIGALAESYQLIPVYGAKFEAEKLLNVAVNFMGQYIRIGFQICLPIFAAILMLNAVLGILAKVSPQMNMFAIGLQLKVFVGLGVIFLTLFLLPTAAELIFTEARRMTVAFVEALM